MNIIIQSPGFKASEDLEQFVHEKLDKIGKHTHHIISADVTLSKGAEAERGNNYCEIKLEVPGNSHFVKKHSSTFEHAIAESVEALKHMLEREKNN